MFDVLPCSYAHDKFENLLIHSTEHRENGNKPKFDWEAKDHLSELEQFKQECAVFFNGPLSEIKDAQKAGLVDRLPMCHDATFYENYIRQAQDGVQQPGEYFQA